MEAYTTQVPEAAMLAYQRLVQLNLELYKPEVTDWLHSEDAEPALKELLKNVPCLGHVH